MKMAGSRPKKYVMHARDKKEEKYKRYIFRMLHGNIGKESIRGWFQITIYSFVW